MSIQTDSFGDDFKPDNRVVSAAPVSPREEAIERARRALAEFEVGGLATAIPFHRAILEDPAYTEDFRIYTSYIENEFKNDIPAFQSAVQDVQTKVAAEKLVAEVNGKRFEILVHAPEPVVKRHRAKQPSAAGASGTGLDSPMQGTVVKIAVTEGQQVSAGAGSRTRRGRGYTLPGGPVG